MTCPIEGSNAANKVVSPLRMTEPDRFVVSGPGGKLHRGPLRISNDSGELHSAQLMQVLRNRASPRPGTIEESQEQDADQH